MYRSAYRAAEVLLIRSGLWRGQLKRNASRIDSLLRRLWIGREVPNPAFVDGHTMFFPPLSHKFYLEMVEGTYEHETTRVIRSLLRPAMNVVDLGAHIGYYTVLAAREVKPGGRVYAFEPQHFLLAFLAQDVAANAYEDIVTVVPKAVANRSGFASLFLGSGAGLTSSLYAGGFNIGDQTITVDLTTLDEFFRQEGWPKIDLIKMDIEGSEKLALEGMVELSQRNPHLRLVMEFSPVHIAGGGNTPDDLFGVLRSLQFSRFTVIDNGLSVLDIPRDISRLVRIAHEHLVPVVNLLCERV